MRFASPPHSTPRFADQPADADGARPSQSLANRLAACQPQPPAAPAPGWTRAAAQELLRYVEAVGQEGLSAASYSPDRLRAAIASGDEAQLNNIAGPIFMQLAQDLSGGAVRGRARLDWHMTHAGLDEAGRQRLMEQVLRGGGGVGAALDSLLPTHVQYGFLKRALANTPAEDDARRALIRTNLERWRWLPRNSAAAMCWSMCPPHRGVVEWQLTARHRTVVGAGGRRTAVNANAPAVTLNHGGSSQSLSAKMAAARGAG